MSNSYNDKNVLRYKMNKYKHKYLLEKQKTTWWRLCNSRLSTK